MEGLSEVCNITIIDDSIIQCNSVRCPSGHISLALLGSKPHLLPLLLPLPRHSGVCCAGVFTKEATVLVDSDVVRGGRGLSYQAVGTAGEGETTRLLS